jgi:hypothetical protein
MLQPSWLECAIAAAIFEAKVRLIAQPAAGMLAGDMVTHALLVVGVHGCCD